MTGAAVVFGLVLLAEWLHARRCRRVAHLAFGPSGKPSEWTWAVPLLRAVAMAMLFWGLLTLYLLDPKVKKFNQTPEGGHRHLIIALDVSPSMHLKDAGIGRSQTRAKRAAEVLMSVLERIALDQVRISVVAFYTQAKPVVVDAKDLEVIKNVLNGLPLDQAFEIGKTSLIAGIKAAAELAAPWQPGSTTLVVVSDGDTIPDSGLPQLPRSIAQVLILGVGDARTGTFIDGHLSRQDSSTLRQLALRLRGVYHDGNEKHLPSEQLAALAKALPMQQEQSRGKREAALAATGLGATLMAAIPLALALAGSSWQAGVKAGKGKKAHSVHPVDHYSASQ